MTLMFHFVYSECSALAQAGGPGLSIARTLPVVSEAPRRRGENRPWESLGGGGVAAGSKKRASWAPRRAGASVRCDEPTTIAFAAHALALLTRDYDTALAAMDRAVYLNPNSAQILIRSAHLRNFVSDADRAIDEFSRAMRLSPADPEIGYVLGGLAFAFMAKGDYEKALEYARRSAHEMPRWVGAWRAVATASVKTDRLQEAQEAARRILLLSPHFSVS